ncbi:hematopoietic prostaglandin D synthase isoform X1 [Ornithorhynchus anatinus]|uniref:glutathione transferase n=1 Tax=Ornithorhynchus anatinus TaxID=9258 RepID=A0A6I8P903_ORNAN|nr:hematopoietic prostaglandin D synthase isoform X1 [Ornithorhynchus anatinus]XP_039769671.1 hematopoietic prostaglandin D synthase isoform X1 [Ornithorhynchus anatinus]
MPNLKLVYFNLRGRAEIIRYLFAYMDLKYEDRRIEPADWPGIKSLLPFGKIPILEVDGVTLHQSLAIARYFAREAGLAGKSELEQCQVDAVVDTLDDFMAAFPWDEKIQDVKLRSTVQECRTSSLSKEQAFSKLLADGAPTLLRNLETYLAESEWLVGQSVTWADFYWDICSTTLLALKPTLLDNFPTLVALRGRVQTIPAIAAWISRRPETRL